MGIISNGTTILDNGAFDVSLGNQVLVSETTASGASNVQFTSGIDTTYPVYRIDLIGVTCSTNDRNLQFNLSIDGGSNYNVSKSFNGSYAQSNDNSLAYNGSLAAYNNTGNQTIGYNGGTNASSGISGSFWMFEPGGTTFTKKIMVFTNTKSYESAISRTLFVCGQYNGTDNIDAVKFEFDSRGGTISGIFKLYGFKDS